MLSAEIDTEAEHLTRQVQYLLGQPISPGAVCLFVKVSCSLHALREQYSPFYTLSLIFFY